MSQFNRLGVQNSYNYKVKIGNWSEEQELHELKLKEYLHRKEQASSGIITNDIQSGLSLSLQAVPLSYSEDGFIHVGDTIMLYSLNTEGVLSCDPQDKVSTGDKGFAVSTSNLTKAHVARNSFVLEAYPSSQSKAGDVLRYGQNLRLRAHQGISSDAYYLHSQPISSLSSSKVSRQQEVAMVLDHSYDSVWKIHYRDITKRFEYEGTPIHSNSEVIIVHAQTQQALSSNKATYLNDFGLENEVSAHTSLSNNKNHGLLSEFSGKRTVDVPVRSELTNNHWAILTAPAPHNNNNENPSNNNSNTAQR
jgi:hypothetical protein